MNDYAIADYTYNGLRKVAIAPTLAYLIGLVNSPDNQMADPEVANWKMSWLFSFEGQAKDASYLVKGQDMPLGYYPQTPIMLTKKWSPIGAMLESGLNPLVLTRREGRSRFVASGIWKPGDPATMRKVEVSKTPQELFWAVLDEAFRRAKSRGMLVSVVAQVGWAYETNIGSLPKWEKSEINKADRILWQRTPECFRLFQHCTVGFIEDL